MKLCLAAFVGSALSCALAQDMPELSFNGSAEVRSAYLSRGKVVDSRPFSAQFADGRIGLWGWGSVGAKEMEAGFLNNMIRKIDYVAFGNEVAVKVAGDDS